MSYIVRVEHAIGRPVAVVRRKVDSSELSSVVPELCGVVWQALKAAQVKDAGHNIAIYRNAGEGFIDVEVGVEVGTPFPGLDAVIGSATPTGEVATVAHIGPYPGLGNAHQAIHDWCSGQGRTLTGVRWELYGHWLPAWNNDPSQIRTDVFYLIER